MQQNRSVALDVVRGVAILAVVAVHSMQASLLVATESGIVEGDRIFTALSYLRFGPELFFALSGWLLFSINDSRAETASAYWARRFARIWPLWIVFTLLTYVGIGLHWTFTPAGRGLDSDLGSLTLSAAISIVFLGWLSGATWNIPAGGWSIQSEMGHYGLFWLLRRWSPFLLLVSVLLGFLTWWAADQAVTRGSGLVQVGAEAWIRLGLFGTWPFFVAGGVAYLWLRRCSPFGWKELLTIAVIFIVGWDLPIPFGRFIEGAVITTLLFLVAAILNRLRILQSPFARIGRTSYFIYFAHFWVLAIVVLGLTSIGLPGQVPAGLIPWFIVYVALFTVALLASWGVSLISWRFLESPVIQAAKQVK